MRRQIVPAIAAVVVMTAVAVLFGLVTTAGAMLVFPDQARGSLVKDTMGKVVGSSLVGQDFTSPKYFQPRPSAASYAPGPDYSYGSNEGANSQRFLEGEDDPETADVDESTSTGVTDRVAAYRKLNGLAPGQPVPVDAVTASGSGLDPQISVANAKLQAVRVARERGMKTATVLGLIDDNTQARAFLVMGEPGVNVLELNLALDRAA